MNYIYKYLKMEHVLEAIEDNTIKVSNPNDYNDPFDSIIDISKKDVNKAIDIIGEYYFAKAFSKFLNNTNLNVSFFAKTLILLDCFILKLYLLGYKRIKYYGSIPFFPFLSKMILNHANKEQYEEKKKKFTDEILNIANGVREKALIACLSRDNKSITMWGHYADDHKGVCLEFEKPNNDFNNVNYLKKRVPIDLEYITRVLLGYDLANEPISENDDKLIKGIMKPFFTKSAHWKNEKEVRSVFSINSDGINNKVVNGENLFFYKMPTKISKIYIGCKADIKNEQTKKVIIAAQEKGIKVLYMKENKEKYALDIIE